MRSGTSSILGVVVLLVVTAGVIAYLVFFPISFKGLGVQAPVDMPDASRLGLIAVENGVNVGYVGHEDGTFEKMPPLLGGEKFLTMARGGRKIMVLTQNSDTGGNAIYEYVDGKYAKRYEGVGLAPFLEVSPDGTRVGFISLRDGSGRAYAFTLDAGTPRLEDLGAGNGIHFFIHDDTTGVWIVNGGTLSARVFSDGKWRDAKTVYESKNSTEQFALNGASRFAFKNPDSGKTEEQGIDTLSPFTVSSRSSYEPANYSQLFFWGNDFYGLGLSGATGDAVLFPVQTPDQQIIYPISRVIPGVTAVLALNP